METRPKQVDEKFCAECGAAIKAKAEICPHCGVRQQAAPPAGGVNRVTTAVLALLLGWVGAHKFYMGKTGLGIVYLLTSFTLIPALLALIDGLRYLSWTDERFAAEMAKA